MVDNLNGLMKNSEAAEITTKKYSSFGVRHVQIGILFLCVICGSALSLCMSVVILAMTDKKLHGDAIETFDWNYQTQGIILSSAVWGDIPFQIIASLLVQKFGSKKLITFIMFTNGTLSIMTPFIASQSGWMGLCASRFIQGMVQAFTFPCTHTMLGNWAPVTERNRFGNFVYSGIYISTVTTMPLTAFISTSFLGWPWVFYFLGGLSIFCGVLWTSFGADSPAHHKTISAGEKDFIESSLGNEDFLKRKLKTPWRAIASSAPFWVLMITQIGAVWGFTVMIMETPTFLKMALGLNLQNSGLLMALPYAVTWFILQIASATADYLVIKGYFSITGVRKLMNTIGTWGPALFLLLLPLVPATNVVMSIVFIIIIIGLDGISAVGFLFVNWLCVYWPNCKNLEGEGFANNEEHRLNHIDLSPNFAGVLVSLCNTVTSSVCFLAPIVSGYILKDPTDTAQWKIIFFITAAFYFFGNVTFLIYGSGEVQPFNNSYTLQESKDAVKSEMPERISLKNNDMTQET